MVTYAIGDIQGCYDALLRLLDKVGFSDSDRLWLAGDLVNRGPQSLETLRFLSRLGDRVHCVLGNHDLHLLAVHHGSERAKRKDTLQPIFQADDRDELLHWLQQQPLLIRDPELPYIMVHAGIPPNWSFAQAQSYAAEVEQVLQSEAAAGYFAHMYGNQPDLWHDKLQGWDRLRLITNYLTRMRFCTAEGQLDFSSKGPPDKAPQGFAPWYQFPRKAKADAKVRLLFGHWASLMGAADNKRVFALDTGCVWGHRLTALRLQDRQQFSVSGLSQPASD